MTELPYEPDAPIGDYGRWHNARWLAGMQARADDMTQAAMQAHGQSEARRQVQAGQAGLYGHQTPYDRGAANAALPPTVGSDYGRGRPLERLGGTFGHANDSPAPARVDLRFVNQVGGPPSADAVSPTMAWQRGQR